MTTSAILRETMEESWRPYHPAPKVSRKGNTEGGPSVVEAQVAVGRQQVFEFVLRRGEGVGIQLRTKLVKPGAVAPDGAADGGNEPGAVPRVQPVGEDEVPWRGNATSHSHTTPSKPISNQRSPGASERGFRVRS